MKSFLCVSLLTLNVPISGTIKARKKLSTEKILKVQKSTSFQLTSFPSFNGSQDMGVSRDAEEESTLFLCVSHLLLTSGGAFSDFSKIFSKIKATNYKNTMKFFQSN